MRFFMHSGSERQHETILERRRSGDKSKQHPYGIDSGRQKIQVFGQREKRGADEAELERIGLKAYKAHSAGVRAD